MITDCLRLPKREMLRPTWHEEILSPLFVYLCSEFDDNKGLLPGLARNLNKNTWVTVSITFGQKGKQQVDRFQSVGWKSRLVAIYRLTNGRTACLFLIWWHSIINRKLSISSPSFWKLTRKAIRKKKWVQNNNTTWRKRWRVINGFFFSSSCCYWIISIYLLNCFDRPTIICLAWGLCDFQAIILF